MARCHEGTKDDRFAGQIHRVFAPSRLGDCERRLDYRGGGTIWMTVGKRAGCAPGFGFRYPEAPPEV